MRIAFFELHDWEEAYLRERLDAVHTVVAVREALEDKHLARIADAEVVSPFIYSRLTAARLAKLPQLKLIATRTTGFDHIDVAECARRGIMISNVPFYGENTVAEHTFALILALSRKVHEAFVRVRAGNFSLDGLRGFDLKDKTIGVVGAGHIGLHVIRIARGFGMNVLAFDVHRDGFLAEVLGFTYTDLDTLLGRSDIITLHAPYTKRTHHLINRDNVGRIKRGAILINTSRGGLVDTEALLKALDDGILAGAGLDVLEGEEAIYEESALLGDAVNPERLRQALQNHVILKKPNVVFTPHNAFNSQEALERILQTTADNIAAFVAGAPKNVVK
ncbi:MAG TPA: hydroxyacid dehydrogenase [Verrucomicrobiae bacterium]|nr:hydroxyacid dehydrogenase [Verrucomicrobiae bacterium]